MATIANLNILLSLEDKATAGFEKSRRSVDAFGKSLQGWGAGLSAAVTAPVLGMAAVSIKAASDLQESMSAVEQVYGAAADTVIQRSQEAAKAVGLSSQEYLSTSAVLGVYGDTLGLTAGETADFSNALIQGAADLGSFYNASTPEVLEAMQSALRGEFDPLERFGIMMNQAALETYALEQGIWDGNGALTAQQRILAAQGFILDNMGDATGDFARTSGGLANQQKILRAQLKNVAAQMGMVLLPTITKIVKIFGDLLTRFQSISPEWQRWIVLIGLVAAGVGPLLIVLGTFLTMLPAIGAALTVLTGPIGLVIAAIALLTAAYIGNWWGFRDAVNGVAGAVESAIGWLMEFEVVKATIQSVVDTATGLFDRLTGAIGKIGSALLDGDWRTALAGLGDLLSAPAKAVGEFVKGISTGFDPLDSLLTNVGNMFTDFGRIIQELFQGDFSGAFAVFQRLIGRVPEIVSGAFTLIPWSTIGGALLAGVQSLPGYISDITGPVVEKLGDLKGKISGWIRDAIPNDWSTYFASITIPNIPGLDTLKSALDSVATTAGTVGTAISTAATAISNVTITLPAGLQSLIDTIQSAIDKASTLLDLWDRLPFTGGSGGGAEESKAYDDARAILRGPGGGGSSPARMVIPEPDLSIFNLAFTTGIPAIIDTAATDMVAKIAGTVIPAPTTTEFESAAMTLPTTIGRAMNQALQLATTGAQSIVTSVASTLAGLESVGRNAAIGLANGMLGAMVAVQSAALQLALTARRSIEDALKVSSPSRVFMQIGGYLGEGLAIGMERSLPQVANASGAMAAAASVTGRSGAQNGSGGAYGSGGGGFVNYGTYNEADRYWAPEQAMLRHRISTSRR